MSGLIGASAQMHVSGCLAVRRSVCCSQLLSEVLASHDLAGRPFGHHTRRQRSLCRRFRLILCSGNRSLRRSLAVRARARAFPGLCQPLVFAPPFVSAVDVLGCCAAGVQCLRRPLPLCRPSRLPRAACSAPTFLRRRATRRFRRPPAQTQYAETCRRAAARRAGVYRQHDRRGPHH